MNRRAERFLRFALSQLLIELESDISFKKSKSSLHGLFSVASVQTYRCLKGHLSTKSSASCVVEIDCKKEQSFLSSLEFALNGMKKDAFWCEQCKEDISGESEKVVLSLPQYLILTINQSTTESNQVWKQDESFFTSFFSVSLEKNTHSKVVFHASGEEGMKYQLTSVVSLINDDLGNTSPTPVPSFVNAQHLVLQSLLRQEPDSLPQWYLFNDFCIQPSTEAEALSFVQPWKTPVCFVFKNVDFDESIVSTLVSSPRSTPQPFYTVSSLGAPNMSMI